MSAMKKWVCVFWRPDIATFLVGLAIIIGSLMPAAEARAMPGNDLVQHIGAYGLLIFFALSSWGVSALRVALVMLLVICFGVVLEFIQPFVGRAFDLRDIAANSAGIITGGICLLCVRFWWGRSRR